MARKFHTRKMLERSSFTFGLPELSGRRGLIGGRRHHGLLRNRSALGEPFWAEDRSGPAQMPTQAPMAVVYLWRAIDAEGEVLDVAGSN
jgi:hypothetical protein